MGEESPWVSVYTKVDSIRNMIDEVQDVRECSLGGKANQLCRLGRKK